jgi:hypothetical protein
MTRLIWLLAAMLAACSPALDWRDTRFAEADGALAVFPCKPDRVSRRVTIAGSPVMLSLASCSTAGMTFALSHAEFDDAAKVDPALAELRTLAATNIGGTARSIPSAAVRGMTPHALAGRLVIDGHRPDGRPLHEQALFFARERRVFQATLIGDAIDAEAADTFFAALRWPE